MNINYKSSINRNIEEKARGLGMIYPHELKVIEEEGESKND